MKLDNKEYVEIDSEEYVNIENNPNNEIVEMTFWEKGKCAGKTRFFKLNNNKNVKRKIG